MADIQITTIDRGMIERYLLGSIIYGKPKERMLDVLGIIPNDKTSYFTSPDARTVYSVLAKLCISDELTNDAALLAVEIWNVIKAHRKDYNCSFRTQEDLLRYIFNLDVTSLPGMRLDAYRDYAENVKWEYEKTEYVRFGKQLAETAGTIPVSEKDEFISTTESKINTLSLEVRNSVGLRSVSGTTSIIRDKLARMQKWQPFQSGLKTGLQALDNITGGFNPGELIVLAASTGSGKPLTNSTTIPTPHGFRKVSDIEVGDWLFARNGKPTKVIGVFPQPVPREVYEVELKDGRKVKCSRDHLWTVRCATHGGYAEKTLTVGEMLEKGYVRESLTESGNIRHDYKFKLPVCEPVEYPELALPVNPYVVGAFLGDGCIGEYTTQLIFSCADEDRETVDRIAEIIGADTPYKQKGSHSWVFPFKDAPRKYAKGYRKLFAIRDVFLELPTMRCNAGEKSIPPQYKVASIEQRWALVQGLMDTDGCIEANISEANGKKKASMSFCTTSEALARDFQEVLWSLGVEARLSASDRRGKEHRGPNGRVYTRRSVEYEVSIVCPNDMKERFFRLERKRERARRVRDVRTNRDYRYQSIVAIRDLGYEDEMTCFLVDNDEHLFLANDYVVTHNTALSSSIALNVAQARDPRSVLIFSLEMMDDQMTSRAVSNLARVNMRQYEAEFERIVSGFYRNISPEVDDMMRQKIMAQNDRLVAALDYYEQLPIYTDVTPGLNPNEIKSMVLQKVRDIEHQGKPPVGLIVVDYLQIMTPVDRRSNGSRTEEVGDMSRRLKQLAKESGIPILCLAQLNRQAQDGSAPSLSMLRESGAIEQDADKVIFVWGPNKGKSPDDYTDVPPGPDMDVAKRLAWQRDQMKMKITVAKNRSGEQGVCDVIGDFSFQLFLTQSDEYRTGGEAFEQFFDKYYYETRSGSDLFWPMPRNAHPIAICQATRFDKVVEQSHIDSSYNVIGTGMKQKPRQVSVKPTQGQAGVQPQQAPQHVGGRTGGFDMSKVPEPSKSIDSDIRQANATPVVDDLQAEFEELDDEMLDLGSLDDGDAGNGGDVEPAGGSPAPGAGVVGDRRGASKSALAGLGDMLDSLDSMF